MDYEEGFYHVISRITGMRTVAQYDEGVWYMVGCGESLVAKDCTDIGPVIEIPED